MLEHWQATFLESLGRTGNVNMACDFAGIHRSTAYYHRDRSKEFNRRWDHAIALYTSKRREYGERKARLHGLLSGA